jgi:hypothetical protein
MPPLLAVCGRSHSEQNHEKTVVREAVIVLPTSCVVSILQTEHGDWRVKVTVKEDPGPPAVRGASDNDERMQTQTAGEMNLFSR